MLWRRCGRGIRRCLASFDRAGYSVAMPVLDLDELVLRSDRGGVLPKLTARSRDVIEWPLRFSRSGVNVEIVGGAVLKVGVRSAESDTLLLLAENPVTSGQGAGFVAMFVLDFNTQPIVDAVAASGKVEALLEVELVVGSKRMSSVSQAILITRDIIREDEPPASAPSMKATQDEAEAGVVNDKWMTPLRTAQAIAALAHEGGGGTLTAPDGGEWQLVVDNDGILGVVKL